MAEWRQLCEAYNVEEATVPHRPGYKKGACVGRAFD